MGGGPRFVDASCPDRIRAGADVPDRTSVLFDGGAGGGIREGGFDVRRVELRAYRGAGGGGLITSVVYTDRGSIEMAYDTLDGGGGDLEGVAGFLRDNLGLSGVILRSAIALDAELSAAGRRGHGA